MIIPTRTYRIFCFVVVWFGFTSMFVGFWVDKSTNNNVYSIYNFNGMKSDISCITRRNMTTKNPCLVKCNLANLVSNESLIVSRNISTKVSHLFNDLVRNKTTLLSKNMSTRTDESWITSRNMTAKISRLFSALDRNTTTLLSKNMSTKANESWIAPKTKMVTKVVRLFSKPHRNKTSLLSKSRSKKLNESWITQTNMTIKAQLLIPDLDQNNTTLLSQSESTKLNGSWIIPNTVAIKFPCLSKLDRNKTTLLSKAISAKTNLECIKNSTFFHTDIVNPPLASSVYQNSNICKRHTDNKDIFLLIIVLSSTTERNQRDAIRRTWGNVTVIDGKRVARIFLLGKSMNKTVEEKVAEENDQHRDICKEDFLDTYVNLTLKTLMGLRWAYAFCPTAKFILKIDSDVIPNLHVLIKDLQNRTLSGNIVEGHRYLDAEPVRKAKATDETKRRWIMTSDEYPWSVYPPYVAGGSYLLSSDLLPRILMISPHVKHIKLEDVYMGMILNVIGVEPQQNHRYTSSSLICFT